MPKHSATAPSQPAENDRQALNRSKRAQLLREQIEAGLADVRASRAANNTTTLEDERAAEYERRVDDFFGGGSLRSEIEDFDTGGKCLSANLVRTKINTIEFADDGDHGEIIYDSPAYVSPYDKCFLRVRSLEAQLMAALPDEVPQIEADLRKANEKWNVEKERALDDRHREFQRIDRWRAEEGREDHNAARRKVRSEPNADLKDMSEADREDHKADMAAKQAWKYSKRKAGWSEEKITAELPGWWVKRKAKRRKPVTERTPYKYNPDFGVF